METIRIAFDAIAETTHPQFKGGEKELRAHMFFDGTNRIMKGMLVPGASIGMHTHDAGCEVIFITAGQGCVVMDGETQALSAGDCHYCPKGHTHSLINNSAADLDFLAVVAAQ